MAWNRKTECIASLTVLFPLNENERLLTPPLILQPGHSFLIIFVASMKFLAKLLCSSIPVAIAKMLGSKMISVGLKFSPSVRIWYALLHI